jgi:acyl carrier protein
LVWLESTSPAAYDAVMHRTRDVAILCGAALLLVTLGAACNRGESPERGAGTAGRATSVAGEPQTGAPDRAVVVARLRTELARLLKKEADQLPVDRPVAELGADDLTVVEWQMAAERAFGVEIDGDALFDAGTKTKKDLTVISMADIVTRASR